MVTDLLFLTIFHNLPGVSSGEEIAYYGPRDFDRLQTDLRSTATHYLALFSESYEYGEYFSCVDYGIEEDSLDDAEMEIFKSKLPAEERNFEFSDWHPAYIFRGCRAVLDARLSHADLTENRRGIELFNEIMESALPTDDRQNPRCYIQLETAKEFGPEFVDNLLSTIQSDEDGRAGFRGVGGQRSVYEPMQPLLKMLAGTVHHERWPHNDLALGKLLLLVDYYQQLTEL